MLQHGKALQLYKRCGNSSEMRRCASEWSRRRIVLIISVHSMFRMATTTGMEFRSCTWRWGAAFTFLPSFHAEKPFCCDCHCCGAVFIPWPALARFGVCVVVVVHSWGFCIVPNSFRELFEEEFLAMHASTGSVWASVAPRVVCAWWAGSLRTLILFALKMLQCIWKTNGS